MLGPGVLHLTVTQRPNHMHSLMMNEKYEMCKYRAVGQHCYVYVTQHYHVVVARAI